MVRSIKDICKMIGIIIISFCAVFVCTLFLNYNIDLKKVAPLIENDRMQYFYDALKMTGTVVVAVSGGCLLLTSVVMLAFYIKQYIDTHRKELGILKALGYSNLKIAKEFWPFGLSICIGAGLGFLASLCQMPSFYDAQNKDHLIPDVSLHIHVELILLLILLPSILFSVLAVGYAFFKLKTPTLELLRGKSSGKIRKSKNETDLPFLTELRKSTVRQKKSLVFFMGFAAFCYSAMMQMSAGMDELSSEMMSVMILAIGILLAFMSLFLATTTVIRANMKTIAMMKVFGYPLRQCSKAILSGYRPIAYVGFAIGTVYQYGLLQTMVSVIFKDVSEVPAYQFDVPAFVFTLISFVAVYETVMYCYTRKIRKISVKEIMLASE